MLYFGHAELLEAADAELHNWNLEREVHRIHSPEFHAAVTSWGIIYTLRGHLTPGSETGKCSGFRGNKVCELIRVIISPMLRYNLSTFHLYTLKKT